MKVGWTPRPRCAQKAPSGLLSRWQGIGFDRQSRSLSAAPPCVILKSGLLPTLLAKREKQKQKKEISKTSGGHLISAERWVISVRQTIWSRNSISVCFHFDSISSAHHVWHQRWQSSSLAAVRGVTVVCCLSQRTAQNDRRVLHGVFSLSC